MTPQAIMIFAAGLGTRMGALTKDQPKPMILVAGRALIDHALDLTNAIAPLTRVVNTHYRGAMVKAHLADQDVQFSDEPELLLETGGGLRKALPILGQSPVFTLNSDAIWRGPNPLLTLATAWDPTRMEALLLLVPPDRALGHTGKGDFLLGADNRLTRGPGLIYPGAQIIRTEGLADIPQQVFSLNLLWDQMATRGALFGIPYDGQWCDVGRPESIPLAEALLNSADVS
jgi:N-acetyl-alpha-D-muramate 1-phosphate uridylyltransferase